MRAPKRDFYAMEVDRERNCYTYGDFGHMAYHCRNKGRRVKYEGERFKGNLEYSDNLKRVENLESLN